MRTVVSNCEREVFRSHDATLALPLKIALATQVDYGDGKAFHLALPEMLVPPAFPGLLSLGSFYTVASNPFFCFAA